VTSDLVQGDAAVLPGPLAEPRIPATGSAARAAALIRAARPRQWVKNSLVAAAPLAAGSWLHPRVVAGTALAFVAFTLTAAGCYLVNDVQDAPRDRLHPVKRLRPVASGDLPASWAAAAGLLLVAAGPLVAVAGGRGWLAALVAVYAATTLVYSAGAKAVPVVETVLIASGFVLRPLAGAAASGVPPSGWFLGACCCGALMVVAGKRLAELRLPAAAAHRRVLARYRPAVVRVARTAAAAALLGCYIGWAVARRRMELPTAVVSSVAVIAAVVRYGVLADRGASGQPERLLVRDRILAACAVVWLGSFLLLPLAG
jgi:decaprenyl-phosphate phosphoribosyltransferase